MTLLYSLTAQIFSAVEILSLLKKSFNSFLNELSLGYLSRLRHNESLEFLGDSVLEIIVRSVDFSILFLSD